jgi:hypothetical protein
VKCEVEERTTHKKRDKIGGNEHTPIVILVSEGVKNMSSTEGLADVKNVDSKKTVMRLQIVKLLNMLGQFIGF